MSYSPGVRDGESEKASTTILFSTTRNWNVGDEFILFGVRTLLDSIVGPYNPVIYNRNPDLHRGRIRARTAQVRSGDAEVTADLRPLWERFTFRADNSWTDARHTRPLVSSLLEADIPVMYLGLGGWDGLDEVVYDELPRADRTLLERALLVTVRDRLCETLLAPIGTSLLPCPSLFAAPEARPRKKINRIALSMQGRHGESEQAVSEETWRFSMALGRALARRFTCAVVCHYVDELATLPTHFADMPVRYSYDAADYFGIYDEFDLTVTTRVHGAGICASLGIPGFLLRHSSRASTAEGFLGEWIDPQGETVDAVVERIASFDVESASRRLMEHKDVQHRGYAELLGGALRRAGLV